MSGSVSADLTGLRPYLATAGITMYRSTGRMAGTRTFTGQGPQKFEERLEQLCQKLARLETRQSELHHMQRFAVHKWISC